MYFVVQSATGFAETKRHRAGHPVRERLDFQSISPGLQARATSHSQVRLKCCNERSFIRNFYDEIT